MMPPSRCWIVFRLVSASMTPAAIAALSSGARTDHAPKPTIKTAMIPMPAQAISRK
jgi:hypothetical protein